MPPSKPLRIMKLRELRTPRKIHILQHWGHVCGLPPVLQISFSLACYCLRGTFQDFLFFHRPCGNVADSASSRRALAGSAAKTWPSRLCWSVSSVERPTVNTLPPTLTCSTPPRCLLVAGGGPAYRKKRKKQQQQKV